MNNLQKSEGPQLSPELVQQVLIYKNTKGLSAEQKVNFLNALCAGLGMNPLTSPFDFLNLNGKEVPYAKKDATDQLRRIHAVSIDKLVRETVEGVYVVTATARMPSGRTDESVGAVPIANLKGDALANAMMKAETKAKRRVTLSICGLGILDETEVDTIPNATVPSRNVTPDEPAIPKSLIEDVVDQESDDDPGNFEITIGKKFKGQRIADCDYNELAQWLDWYKDGVLKGGTDKNGQKRVGRALTHDETMNMVMFGRYERARMNGGRL